MQLLDAVFVTRPIVLVPVWGYFLIGYHASGNHDFCEGFYALNVLSFITVPILIEIGALAWITLSLLTMSVASTYILNQLVDINTDKNNEGLPLIAKGGFSVKTAIVECIILGIAPLVLAVLLKLNSFILVLLIAATLLNILYNLKPFYFTGRPFLDFISNATGFGLIAFGLGWFSATNFEMSELSAMLKSAFPYFLLMAAGSINSTIPDIQGDIETGKITTAVRIGTQKANLMSIVFITAALAVSFINGNAVAIMASCISLPLFIKYHLTGSMSDAKRSYEIGGGSLLLLISFIVPGYMLAGLITFFATRLYFRKRYGIRYP